MRPPAMARLAYPRPAPRVSQTRAGPPSGHSCRSPVSFDTAVRSDPRNVGQLPAVAGRNTSNVVTSRKSKARARRETVGGNIKGAPVWRESVAVGGRLQLRSKAGIDSRETQLPIRG